MLQVYRVTESSPEWQRIAYDYIRTDAFVVGNGIPIELEYSDAPQEHRDDVLLLVDDHVPVAGCLVQYPSEGTGRLEIVGVVRERQGTGLGRILIREAEAWLAEKGIRHVVIDSRVGAEDFYFKCGYTLSSEDPDQYEILPESEEEKEKQEKKREAIHSLGFSCVLVEKYLP